MAIFTAEGFNSYYTNLINLNTSTEKQSDIVVLNMMQHEKYHTPSIPAKYGEPESNQDSGASFHLQKLWEKGTNGVMAQGRKHTSRVWNVL